MSNDRPRQWLTIEAAAAEFGGDTAAVDEMIQSGQLQTKLDSFGATLVSALSIRAAAGQLMIRGVR